MGSGLSDTVPFAPPRSLMLRAGGIALAITLAAIPSVYTIIVGAAHVIHILVLFVLIITLSSRIRYDLMASFLVLVAFPPVGLGCLLGPVVYVPLILLCQRRTSWKASALTGVFFGWSLGYVLAGWTTSTLARPLLADVTMLLVSGLLGALLALGIRASSLLPAGVRFAATTVVITAVEWLRCCNPILSLPYLLTAHLVAENPYLAQWAEVTGFWGLSVWSAAFCVIVAAAIEEPRLRLRIAGFLSCLLLMALIAGAVRYHSLASPGSRSVRFLFVQDHNPRQSHAVDTVSDGQLVIDRLKEAVGQIERPDFVLLPEGTVVIGWTEQTASGEVRADPEGLTPERLQEVVADWRGAEGPPVIAGTSLMLSEGSRRNSVCLFKEKAVTPSVVRDKVINAPIGESVPFDGIPLLEHVGGALAECRSRLVAMDTSPKIDHNGVHFAVCVCFEHVLPDVWSCHDLSNLDDVDIQAAFGDMRWFEYSPVERQQSRSARRLHAIMHRTPFVYVANGGSEWINCRGEVVQALSSDSCSVEYNGEIPFRQEVLLISSGVGKWTSRGSIVAAFAFLSALGWMVSVAARGTTSPKEGIPGEVSCSIPTTGPVPDGQLGD